MRISAPIHPSGCCHLKLKMLPLSEHLRQVPQQPVQNHSSGRRWGWAKPRSAEEMMFGQRQRAHIPAHAKTAHSVVLQKKPEGDLCWIIGHVPPMTQSVNGLDRTELNTYTSGRLACSIVQSNCLFKAVGQESCQLSCWYVSFLVTLSVFQSHSEVSTMQLDIFSVILVWSISLTLVNYMSLLHMHIIELLYLFVVGKIMCKKVK